MGKKGGFLTKNGGKQFFHEKSRMSTKGHPGFQHIVVAEIIHVT